MPPTTPISSEAVADRIGVFGQARNDHACRRYIHVGADAAPGAASASAARGPPSPTSWESERFGAARAGRRTEVGLLVDAFCRGSERRGRPPATNREPCGRPARAPRSRRPASAGSRDRPSRCRARRSPRPPARRARRRPRRSSNRLLELPGDLRLLGVAEVEAVRQPDRLASRARDVQRGAQRSLNAGAEPVALAEPRALGETADPRMDERGRDPGGVQPRAAHGARADEVVVLAVDPALAPCVRLAERQLAPGGDGWSARLRSTS